MGVKCDDVGILGMCYAADTIFTTGFTNIIILFDIICRLFFLNIKSFKAVEPTKHSNDKLNENDKNITDVSHWMGRKCCYLAETKKCYEACQNSTNTYNLYKYCRISDEISLFQCALKEQSGEDCCGQTKYPQCYDTCRDILITSVINQTVFNKCEKNVRQCVTQVMRKAADIKPPPPKRSFGDFSLRNCCLKTNNVKCKEICKSINASDPSTLITELMVKNCGPQQPSQASTTEIFFCILHGSKKIRDNQTKDDEETYVKKITQNKLNRKALRLLKKRMQITDNRQVHHYDIAPAPMILGNGLPENFRYSTGKDAFKLECCKKARNSECRSKCRRMHYVQGKDLGESFDRECHYNITEQVMSDCIDDVSDPCEVGCNGLKFCSNYNNRPNQLFRSCDPSMDEFTELIFDEVLKSSQLDLPYYFPFKIYMKNLDNPESLKSILCALQLRPCHRISHSNKICRLDCLRVFKKHFDLQKTQRYTSEALTSLDICEKLVPENDPMCISSVEYEEPSQVITKQPEITTPCRNDPCGIKGVVCMVNRMCHLEENCTHFSCVPGCSIGEFSSTYVPLYTYIKISIGDYKLFNQGCWKICQCKYDRRSRDVPVLICKREKCEVEDNRFYNGSCRFFNDTTAVLNPASAKIENGQRYTQSCNLCACYDGEIICGSRQCNATNKYNTLPCDCINHFTPVCGTNGVTYHSECIAHCRQNSQVQFYPGDCYQQNPCRNSTCFEPDVCITHRKTCLVTENYSSCPQYECVDPTDCEAVEPICDTKGYTHKNYCIMRRNNREMQYYGPCTMNPLDCKWKDEICGVDGNTYRSECDALTRFVSVDYEGPCRTIGTISDYPGEKCKNIQCPPLPTNECMAVTPTGACCPICAGALKLFYSPKHINEALMQLSDMEQMKGVSLDSVLLALERHIQVAQCRILGHMTIEHDIIVMVVPTTKPPTEIQLNACVLEAEKLVKHLSSLSPRLMNELNLNFIASATTLHKQYSGALILKNNFLHLVLTFFLIINIL